ncbi:MAG: hypothetical protein WBK19_14740 [Azonexus sp.]
MSFEWPEVAGLILVVVGLHWVVKRNIPVGLEGRPPSFYLIGKWAVLAGLVAILAGLVLVFDLPKQIAVDKCLDAGGSYDYERGRCELGTQGSSR